MSLCWTVASQNTISHSQWPPSQACSNMFLLLCSDSKATKIHFDVSRQSSRSILQSLSASDLKWTARLLDSSVWSRETSLSENFIPVPTSVLMQLLKKLRITWAQALVLASCSQFLRVSDNIFSFLFLHQFSNCFCKCSCTSYYVWRVTFISFLFFISLCITSSSFSWPFWPMTIISFSKNSLIILTLLFCSGTPNSLLFFTKFSTS